jgi:hypoxanthine phosphoribosyltransferase
MPEKGVARILIPEQELRMIVETLGGEITRHCRKTGGELLVVGLLKGSFIFMADLVRAIEYPMTIDFLAVSSYSDATVSSGKVAVKMDIGGSIEGKTSFWSKILSIPAIPFRR